MRSLVRGIASLLKAFWAGLVTPTTLSWVGAALLCVGELVAAAVYFSPRRLAQIDPRFLMASPRDEYMPLSLELLRLRQTRLTGLHVAYFGASQATRSLADLDEDDLSDEVTSAAGQPVRFHLLSANNERFEDVLGATDQLPPSFRGVVVLMVSDYNDDYGKYKTPEALTRIREHIAFVRAPSLAPVWEESDYHPRNTGYFFLDHFGFFAARREVAVRLHPVSYIARSQGFVDQGKRALAANQLEADRELLEEDGMNRAKRQASMRAPVLKKSGDVLETLLDNMKSRGIAVVIVEAPVFPLRAEVYARRIARYRAELRRLVDAKGARYYCFDEYLDLRDVDFQDKVHLGTPAKRRMFQTLLMMKLGDVIRTRYSDDADAADVAAPAGTAARDPSGRSRRTR